MQKIYYTDNEVQGLQDCEVLYNYTEWRSGHKFLRRGINQITCLCNMGDNKWMIVKRSHADVRIDGEVLPRISRYYFTNPNRPFNRNL